MFVKSQGLQFVISIVGVIVFTGLTAWDAQKLKAMAEYGSQIDLEATAYWFVNAGLDEFYA